MANYKKRGYRQFLNLALRLARFASKYQTNIKDEGPPELDALMGTIIALLPLIESLILPGPE
jgi:hypothetical protein